MGVDRSEAALFACPTEERFVQWTIFPVAAALGAGALAFLSVVADQMTIVRSRLELRRKHGERHREQTLNAPPVTVEPEKTP